MSELKPIDFWHFCEDLTVVQAALLILGHDPSELQSEVFKENTLFKPAGFDAIFSGITQAIINEKLNARFRSEAYELHGFVTVRNGERFDRLAIGNDGEVCRIAYKKKPNWDLTTVNVDDLKAWLLSRNIKPAFFFDEQSSNTPDYLDPNHPRYSEKLAATVKVWLAMNDSNLLEGKAIIPTLENWLESRYKELGLTYKNEINKTAIKECAKVANWNPDGGATKTPEKT